LVPARRCSSAGTPTVLQECCFSSQLCWRPPTSRTSWTSRPWS